MLVIVVLPNPGPQPVFDEMRLFGASRDGRAVAHRAIAPLNQLNSRAEEAQIGGALKYGCTGPHAAKYSARIN